MEKGDFKNCLLHGYRERMFRNGSVEKGEFKNGVLHGCGEVAVNGGCHLQKGEFKNGVLQGCGEKMCSN